MLVVAGVRGILKVINLLSFELEATLRGHGHDIDDLTVHPVDLNLVLSASKDESVRLWNIKNEVCIAIFGGENAHRDDVLSIDVHPLGTCFASSGMDTSIKIWNLASPSLQRAISDSYMETSLLHTPLAPLFEQMPLFSTTQVHKDYVDTVAWVGNLILTKSTSNRAALWAPDPDRYPVSEATCIYLIHIHEVQWSVIFHLLVCLGCDLCAPRVPTQRLQYLVCSIRSVCPTGSARSRDLEGKGIANARSIAFGSILHSSHIVSSY